MPPSTRRKIAATAKARIAAPASSYDGETCQGPASRSLSRTSGTHADAADARQSIDDVHDGPAEQGTLSPAWRRARPHRPVGRRGRGGLGAVPGPSAVVSRWRTSAVGPGADQPLQAQGQAPKPGRCWSVASTRARSLAQEPAPEVLARPGHVEVLTGAALRDSGRLEGVRTRWGAPAGTSRPARRPARRDRHPPRGSQGQRQVSAVGMQEGRLGAAEQAARRSRRRRGPRGESRNSRGARRWRARP